MTLKELSYKISMSIGIEIATEDYYNGRETIVYHKRQYENNTIEMREMLRTYGEYDVRFIDIHTENTLFIIITK